MSRKNHTPEENARREGSVKIIAQNCLQAPAERSQPAIKASSRTIPSRFMRKFVYRLRLNEVSRQ